MTARTPGKERTRTLTMRCSETEHDVILRLANYRRISMAEVVRQLAGAELAREEAQRAANARAALAAVKKKGKR